MRSGVAGGVAIALLASSALAAPQARVTLRPNATGVAATLVLPSPINSFAFDQRANDVRDDAWHTPAGMTLKDGVLRRQDGRKFSSVTIQLTPDTAPRDRRYPALTRIGDGWQVYGPYFAGKDVAVPAATVVVPKGWRTLPSQGGEVSLAGYVYLGPAGQVTESAATVVASSDFAQGLRDQITRVGQGATAYYTRRLGVALPRKPTLLVTRVPTFKSGWQGDTVPGTMISLRFLGASSGGPERTDRVTNFVAHEFFHFWNGELFDSRDGDNEAWLHEGAAEYAALLASRELGALDEAGVAQALVGRLTACVAALKDKGMADSPPKRGKAVYDCGVTVQWAADLKLRAASGGKRDVLDAWREVFAYATAGDKHYDAKGFLAAAGMTQAADDPLRLLIQPGDDGRWDRLASALNAAGARVTRTRSQDADRGALMFALLGPICTAGYGFFGGDGDFITLDTGRRCKAANGNPKVDRVAGKDVVADASGAFDAVTALCASGSGEVPLSYKGLAVASLPCRKMPPAPLAWTISKWR